MTKRLNPIDSHVPLWSCLYSDATRIRIVDSKICVDDFNRFVIRVEEVLEAENLLECHQVRPRCSLRSDGASPIGSGGACSRDITLLVTEPCFPH